MDRRQPFSVFLHWALFQLQKLAESCIPPAEVTLMLYSSILQMERLPGQEDDVDQLGAL